MGIPGERWTVGMLPVALAVGTVVDRRAWPLHVTIAGNFATSADVPDVIAAVARASPSEDVVVELGPEAAFSTGLTVLLVASVWIEAVHERLAGELEALPGYEADEPRFWREGYVPHVTLGPNVTVGSGERIRLASIAVSCIRGGEAEVIAEFPLASGRSR